jgi:hypothetical protein
VLVQSDPTIGPLLDDLHVQHDLGVVTAHFGRVVVEGDPAGTRR